MDVTDDRSQSYNYSTLIMLTDVFTPEDAPLQHLQSVLCKAILFDRMSLCLSGRKPIVEMKRWRQFIQRHGMLDVWLVFGCSEGESFELSLRSGRDAKKRSDNDSTHVPWLFTLSVSLPVVFFASKETSDSEFPLGNSSARTRIRGE